MKRTITKTLSLFLAVLTLMSVLCVSASANYDPDFPWLYIDNKNGVTYYISDKTLSEAYPTSSRVEGKYSSTSDYQYPPHFSGKDESITTVAIPQGVEDVRGKLDTNLPNLKTIVIPRSIKTLTYFVSIDWMKPGKTYNLYYEGTGEEWDQILICQDFINQAKRGAIKCKLYVNCSYYSTGNLDGDDSHIDIYHRLGQYDPAQHTMVTATTSGGQVENYDIYIDPEFYNISYKTESREMRDGVTLTGLVLSTISDRYASQSGKYRYIEHIVIPQGTKAILGASGTPSTVIVPRSVKAIDGFFYHDFSSPYVNVNNVYFYNPYFPNIRVLYEGTEEEWKNIAVYSYLDGKENYAKQLYDLGCVRFNCNYYDVAKPITKEEKKPEPEKPKAPVVSTIGGSGVNTTQFTDVSLTDYYGKAVLWAVNNKVTSGVTDTTFEPNTTCTQAQVITFLYRAAGGDMQTSMSWFEEDIPFGMTYSTYYYEPVCWAYYHHLIDDSWKPDAPCTRATAMQYIYKAKGSPSAGASKQFSDVPSGSASANAIAWAVDKGITSGTTDSTFSPGKTCTRGQIMTFLYRAFA